jgi:hypothetical protein
MKCSNDHEVQENDKYCGVCGDEIVIKVVHGSNLSVEPDEIKNKKGQKELMKTISRLDLANSIIYVLSVIGGLALVATGIDGSLQCTETGLFGTCDNYERKFDLYLFSFGMASILVGSLIFYLIKSWTAFLTYKVDSETDK